MPISTLDPVTALVVIDLQKGILAYASAEAVMPVVRRTAELAAAFRARGLPVALVTVAGRSPGRTDQQRPPFAPPPGFTDLLPELPAHPGDLLITKHTIGAFHGTGLDMQLRRRGVTQIVLCGVSTSNGVEWTARSAFEHGYHVTFARDAMADTDPEAHAHSLGHAFPRIGEVGTTAEILAKLAERPGHAA